MPGPWDKYSSSPQSSDTSTGGGQPWAKYQAAAKQTDTKAANAPPKDNRSTFEKIATFQSWPERFVGEMVSGVGGALKAGATLTKEALTDPAKYSQDVQNPAKVLPAASLGVTAAPAAGAALAQPLSSFGKSLTRTAEENLQNKAVGKVTTRLEQGGTTAADAIKQVNEGNTAGKPMTLADVGGKPTERLAGSVYRSGGEATNVADKFLDQRDKAAGARLSDDITKYVYGGQTMRRTTQALLDARSQEGKPLWEQVRAMQGVWSPRLQQFIDDPTIKSAMARGYKIERLESLAENRPFDPTQMGVDLDAEGNIKIIAAPNMRVLHMAKMGLDAMIADERNEITGRLSQMGVALDKARRAYLGEIDSLDTTSIYKQARYAWEGKSKSLDAVRSGRSIFTSPPEEVAAEFAELSPSDKEFYRVGVADKLREQLGKTGVSGDEAKSILRNPWVESQLQPIFPSPKEFNAFVDQVAKESQMFRTNVRIRGGSQTAERIEADNETAEGLVGAADIGKSAISGEWLSAIRKAIRMKRDLGLRQDPALNERIAKLLFSTEPDLTTVGIGTSGQGGNWMAAAPMLQAATPGLVPGAASALAQPGQ
jgi:hypothetical protein